MFSIEETIKLKNAIISQKDNQIRELNKKLDSVVNERNDLRQIYSQLKNYEFSYADRSRLLFDELFAKHRIQEETLKTVAKAEYQCGLKNDKLEDEIDNMNHEIKILENNKNKLQSELADSETRFKCVQDELNTIKLEFEGKNSLIKKLENNFKHQEQELYKVRKELDNCKTKCNELNKTKKSLNMDLKGTKQMLCDTKISVKQMEQMFKIEREQLSNELELSSKKIKILETHYSEAKKEFSNERYIITKTVFEKLKKLNDNTNLKANKKLEEFNESLCCVKEKINELEKENDRKCMEINTLKNKLHEREGQLQKMSLLSEKIEKFEENISKETCTKKKTRTKPCCPSCRSQDSMTDMCSNTSNAFNDKKVATISDAHDKNIHKTALNNLVCVLGKYVQSIFLKK